MTSPAFEQVRSIAADIFSVSPDHITSQSSPQNLDAWDSTQHLSFVLALEERFNLQFSPEEMEQMRDVGSTVQVIETKLHGN